MQVYSQIEAPHGAACRRRAVDAAVGMASRAAAMEPSDGYCMLSDADADADAMQERSMAPNLGVAPGQMSL